MNKLILTLVIMLFCVTVSGQVFPGKQGFDKYGGYLSYKGKKTGRFHLDKINGRHFLITPDGHGFISLGVTHTRGISIPEGCKHDYFKENCKSSWDNANKELFSNFQKWGYNTLGYGSNLSSRKRLPHFASCNPGLKISSWMGKQKISFPDVFSDDWKKKASLAIERMMKQYQETANLIGIYWTDMPAWDFKQARRTAGKTWVDAIRELPDNAPGKIRYKQYLKDKGNSAADEDFLLIIAKEYYSHIGPLTRKLAPKTLIFGDRYSGSDLPNRVIMEALPWIDVISIQPNGDRFKADEIERLYRQAKKPVIFCDHQVSFNTPEHKKVMWKTLGSVEEVGRVHEKFLNDAFEQAYIIGYHRCQYIDRYKEQQSILKQGVLQADGKPYPKLEQSIIKNTWQIHQKFMNKQ